VDDESSIRTLAERVLGDAGYAVDTVSNGPDALSIVEHESSFDLFVIDEMMPEMREDELARQLREAVSLQLFEHTHGPKAPDGVSALSAVTKPTPDETCRRCGSLLFPPHLAPGMMIPAAANLVCLKCGRAYEWTGTPPRLSVVAPNVESGEDEDD
jgi:CheY-like chemotaxis protein